MNGVVVYLADKALATSIKRSLEEKYGFEFQVVAHENLKEIKISQTRCIALEWSLRYEMCVHLVGIGDSVDVTLYNDRFVSDIDNSQELDGALSKALILGDYDTCKAINEFYLAGDVIRKRAILRSFPVNLQLETTDLCNARCIMCSHSYDSGTGLDLFDSGIVDRITPILPFLKMVILHGNGEPFLSKQLVCRLNELSKYGIRFATNTNLSIVTDDILQVLNTSFNELTVSCDGYDKRSYESIRRGLSFEAFVENCKTVRECCPTLIMKMAVVMMRQNMHRLPEIIHLAHELGFNEVLLNQLCVDKRLGNTNDDPYLYRSHYIESIEKANIIAQECGMAISAPPIQRDDGGERPDSKSHSSSDLSIRGICDWLVEQPFINIQGDVSICCINQKIRVGNIFTDDIMSLWNNSSYQNYRKTFFSGKIEKCCLGCDFLLQRRLHFIAISDLPTYEHLKKSGSREDARLSMISKQAASQDAFPAKLI
jgi:hypothetical protein